jgi:hypothetical protein
VHTPKVQRSPDVQAAGPDVQLAPSVHQAPDVQVDPSVQPGDDVQ